jgi:hypothetical protein
MGEMKRSSVVCVVAIVFVFTITFILMYFAGEREPDANIAKYHESISDWQNRLDMNDIGHENIRNLELILNEQEIKLIELKFIDVRSSEIIASKDSGRIKLTKWFPSEKIVQGFKYKRYNFVGSEGEFPVLQFYFSSPQSSITIEGLIKLADGMNRPHR